jgi:adenine C2-methylase RlmN of 23S rRNA A2503 and tRNA A37
MNVYQITDKEIRDTLINSTETITTSEDHDKCLSYKLFRKNKRITTEYLVLVHTDKKQQVINIINMYITSRRRLRYHGFIVDQ